VLIGCATATLAGVSRFGNSPDIAYPAPRYLRNAPACVACV